MRGSENEKDACFASIVAAISQMYGDENEGTPSGPLEQITKDQKLASLKECMLYAMQRHALSLSHAQFGNWLERKFEKLREECGQSETERILVDSEVREDVQRIRAGEMTLAEFWDEKWSKRREAWGLAFKDTVFDTRVMVGRAVDALSNADEMSEGQHDLLQDLTSTKSVQIARLLSANDLEREAINVAAMLRETLDPITNADDVFDSLVLFDENETLCIDNQKRKNLLRKQGEAAMRFYQNKQFNEAARSRYEALDTPELERERGESEQEWRERRREAAIFRRTYEDGEAQQVRERGFKIIDLKRGRVSDLQLASRVKEVRDNWLAQVRKSWKRDFGEIPIKWIDAYMDERKDALGYLNPGDGKYYSVKIDFPEASEGVDLFQNLEDCNVQYLELLSAKGNSEQMTQLQQRLEEAREEIEQLRTAQASQPMDPAFVSEVESELREDLNDLRAQIRHLESEVKDLNWNEVANSEGRRVLSAFRERADYADDAVRARTIAQLRQYFGRCGDSNASLAENEQLCETLSYVGNKQSVCVWDRLSNGCVDNHDVSFLINAIDSVCFQCESIDTELLRRIARTMNPRMLDSIDVMDGCQACRSIASELDKWEEVFATQNAIGEWDRSKLDEFKVMLKSAAEILKEA